MQKIRDIIADGPEWRRDRKTLLGRPRLIWLDQGVKRKRSIIIVGGPGKILPAYFFGGRIEGSDKTGNGLKEYNAIVVDSV